MPYAINDTLSKKPIDGGIEITDAEYKAAMAAKLQGRKAYVHEGTLLIESETQRTVYSTTDGSEKQIADNAPLPDGHTELERPDEYHDWDGAAWVLDNVRKMTEEAKKMERALEAYTDEVAAQRRYRSAESCVSYRGATDTQLDAEAQAFFAWRESLWAAAAAIEADVLAGNRTAPTYEKAIAELPKMVWP